MSVREYDAIFLCVEQVISALSANLAATCATISASRGVPLPTPSEKAYYAGMSRHVADYVLQHEQEAVFVMQQRPSEVVAEAETTMLTPSTRDGAQWTYLEISLFYKVINAEPGTLFGKPGTQTDIMEARGMLYAGALVNTLREFSCDGDVIVDVRKDSDFSGAYRFSDEGLPIIGIATCVMAFRQQLIIQECSA